MMIMNLLITRNSRCSKEHRAVAQEEYRMVNLCMKLAQGSIMMNEL